MRTNNARKTGPTLLDRPEEPRSAKRIDETRRGTPPEAPRPRREYPGTSNNDSGNDDSFVRRNRRIRRGLIPQTRTGRILAGISTLAVLGATAAVALYTTHFLHGDPHFLIASSSNIELRGNQHLSRSQLLSIFGEDVDGNIFNVPLSDRRDQLEQIPWVEHATIMRLLPNRLRIQVTERTPVAFVRQGGSIGMADSSGVLLDIPPDAPGNPNYSFPVVTGLKPTDTPESREQRMHLYSAFLRNLDSEGKKVSTDLSEVDLSDPEDVKALLPTGNSETLVHFGTDNFLSRYKRFQEHIAEWRTQYPRLSSVDMRYERQVVLQMPPKDSTVASTSEAPLDAKANLPKLGTKSTAKLDTKPAIPAQLHTPPRIAPASATSASASLTPSSSATLPSPTSPSSHPPSKQPAHAGAALTKHPAQRELARSAETAKRVEAIKAWMARRQAAREAQATHAQ